VHRRRPPVLLLVVAAALLGPPAMADAPVDWAGRSEVLADQLLGELRTELERALQSGGPLAAIEVCTSRAPAIAERLSRASGAEVGRTALRVRNPANAPDAHERAVLERFARQLAESSAPAAVPPTAQLGVPNPASGGVDHYYMRAIVMQPQCLPCHGATLAPEIAAAIRKNYPADEATGFEPGQLRGAVVVRWPAGD